MASRLLTDASVSPSRHLLRAWLVIVLAVVNVLDPEAGEVTTEAYVEIPRIVRQRVIEIGYDHASAGRIRHGGRFLRFRDDKDPRECRFEDLDEGER